MQVFIVIKASRVREGLIRIKGRSMSICLIVIAMSCQTDVSY
jgi:hypothetical protein